MENVLAAFIIIFLIVFGMLTLTETVLSSQMTVQKSWQEMQTRWEDQDQTSLLPLEAYTMNMGTVAVLILRNNGAQSLTDFAAWDAILQYYDAGTPAAYHAAWLPYTAESLYGSEWAVEGIYLDAITQTPEVYEPGILNPGEEMLLQLRGASPIGAGTIAQGVISTANGTRASLIFAGNFIPVLEVNSGSLMGAGQTITITAEQLQARDTDDTSDHLTYRVSTVPTEGTLSLETIFTQADIDNGLVSYTHTGDESDAFQFTVSDGKDTIGPFSFSITVSTPPVLAVNSGLIISAGETALFDSVHLQTTDPDDQPASLIYTVTQPPAQGTLNLAPTFTQADIDDGLLAYSHTGSGSDSFQIAISDGETEIGSYDVTITVP